MGCWQSSGVDVQPEGVVPTEGEGESRPETGVVEAVEPEVVGEVADWVRLGGAELEQPLREEWVKLIRADWLVQHAEGGGVLQRRQDMPADAYVGLNELKRAGAGSRGDDEWLHVIVLSYPWLQPGHPDPHGQNLCLLTKALAVYVDDEFNGGKPYGVLIDFTALFQVPRAKEEHEVFLRALPALNIFYSHPATVVLKITQFPRGYPHDPAFHYVLPEGANTVGYAQRGWCFAESSMSGLVKSSGNILALRHDYDFHFLLNPLFDLISTCKAGRRPPLHPSHFKDELSTKTFTSRKADFEKVNKLYSDAFEGRVGRAAELDFQGLGWGDDGAQRLLQSLQGSTSLQRLILRENSFGARGAVALAEVVKRSVVLCSLNMEQNEIGHEGAVAFADALRSNRSLRTLNLRLNKIGDEGANALAAALEINQCLQTLDVSLNRIEDGGAIAVGKALESNRSLQTLDLGGNRIGDQGAMAVGKALEGNRSLQTLNLGGNRIGDRGAVAFAEALKDNSALSTLDLGDNYGMSRSAKDVLRGAAWQRPVELQLGR